MSFDQTQDKLKNLKVALVHDYLREYGGGERVLEALHEIFPDAPVYTAYYNPAGLGPHAQRFKNWDIRTSWLQKVPWANRLVSPLRIFAPLMFESFDLGDYDVVISSCAIYFAKAVITKPETLHLSYIHTPPRYLYGYTTSFNYKKKWWTKVGGEILNHFLRIYDFQTSQRPDILVANSQNVADRIKKFYRRDSVVIYPPVEVEKFKNVILASSPKATRPESKNKDSGQAGMTKEGYYLSLSRLVRGKGVDIIIEAATQLNIPLKVAGIGPELEMLKRMAGSNVEFLGEVRDEERAKLYAGAKALIAASEDEDFGITVVEAMACGTPVIAVRAGGYLETVIEGKTGEFFPSTLPRQARDRSGQVKATVEDLVEVLKKFDPKKYRVEDCQKQAEKFSKSRFKREILECIAKNKKEV